MTGQKPKDDDAPARSGWKQNPDAVRANILAEATRIFAEKGFSGARVDDIAARTHTSKRMIYYYFGDKQGLYLAALEQAYADVRRAEDALDLAHADPVDALRRLTEFTFDHHRDANDFMRLVMIENIHRARHIAGSDHITGENSSVIRLVADIYARGVAKGCFRPDLAPLNLHWMISALSTFNVSNRHTFAEIFGSSQFTDTGQAALRQQVTDMVLRYAMASPEAG